MLTREDIDAWLDRLDSGSAEVSEMEPGLWLVRTAAGAEVLVNFAPPVAILRVTVMTLPAGTAQQAKLCRQLLEYNARDLVHGAYGLEGDKVVLKTPGGVEELEILEVRYDPID